MSEPIHNVSSAVDHVVDKPVDMAGMASKIQRRQADINEALASSDLSPFLQQLYANRGVKSVTQVKYSLDRLADYTQLKDINRAADIIVQHIRHDRKILVVGDFDADGATSSALMMRALKMFRATQIGYLVPNRFDYGYGLSPEIVALAAEQSPALIITVDNGISSIDGVAEANRRGIKVVVTDHHLPAQEIPAAEAIVNPNQHGCAFPWKNTAGVGVAFYTMLAVRARLRELDWFAGHDQPNMATLLDLVALGTVADVVPLDDNNRALVELGLQRIRHHRGCAGINALLTIAGKAIAQCSSQDFGFVIGPRLNAAGRLEDMSLGIECLLSNDERHACLLAGELDDINQQRKQIESDMLRQALAVLDHEFFQADNKDLSKAGLALYHPDWHQGVVGLVASRVKEKYHRPVFAFARAEETLVREDGAGKDVVLKGSGRSIPGLHLRDTLDMMEKTQPGLMLKFGGHAMAAGLSIRRDKFELFQQLFNRIVGESLDEKALTMIRQTDGSIPADLLTMQTAELIKFSGPWGQAFPFPLFDDVFKVENWRIVGEKHLKLVLRQVDSRQQYNAIAFNMTDDVLPAGNSLIHASYRLDINEYRNQRNIQLIIDYIESGNRDSFSGSVVKQTG